MTGASCSPLETAEMIFAGTAASMAGAARLLLLMWKGPVWRGSAVIPTI